MDLGGTGCSGHSGVHLDLACDRPVPVGRGYSDPRGFGRSHPAVLGGHLEVVPAAVSARGYLVRIQIECDALLIPAACKGKCSKGRSNHVCVNMFHI